MTTTTMDACRAVLAIAASRALGKTVCPSEVARSLAVAGSTKTDEIAWRSLMPIVHAAVDQLVASGDVQLSWKGQALIVRSGPYRIALR